MRYMKALTPRQTDALLAIHAVRMTRHEGPTVRDLGLALGLTSTGSVRNLLTALVRKRYVIWPPGQPRGLRLTSVGKLLVRNAQPQRNRH